MIITRLEGGLGNQMFQYAAARRLAHVHGTALKLDLAWFNATASRKFGLQHFNITAAPATRWEVAKLCPRESVDRLARRHLCCGYGAFARTMKCLGCDSPYLPRLNKYSPNFPLPPLFRGGVASERHYHFDPEVLKLPDNVCLSGFWQTEKYFTDIRDVLLAEFGVKQPLAGANQAMAHRMRSVNSVSLHVRRGDKVQDKNHVASSAEYCLHALEHFRCTLTAPHFFIFGEDWDWIRTHLPEGSDLTHVTINDDAVNYEDLRLMSLCRHNIVAASSFSWWGAWLNTNPDQRVLCPPDNSVMNFPNYNTRDYFPAGWERIS